MIWEKIRRLESTDRNVFKYVFEGSNAVAEAVLYRYPEFKQRTVICCSTQSGCPIGCRFCGSGDRFVRNLGSQEIVEQVTHVIDDHAIAGHLVEKMQIMFMSMGEPMLNFTNVSDAIRTLSFYYPNAQMLISTMGPDVGDARWDSLIQLSIQIPSVGLQFSVHESTDEARDRLIPFKDKLALQGIADRGYAWAKATHRHPFINYCAHEGNTSDEDVARLRRLFSPEIFNMTVSVVCEREEHVSAANQRQRQLASDFVQKLLRAGYDVRMFDPAGQDDIGGGCGQLWYVQDWMRSHPDLARPSAGAGLPIIHTPGSIP
jgi:23S rRNA (adenine2503-C2)-methyltransferase